MPRGEYRPSPSLIPSIPERVERIDGTGSLLSFERAILTLPCICMRYSAMGDKDDACAWTAIRPGRPIRTCFVALRVSTTDGQRGRASGAPTSHTDCSVVDVMDGGSAAITAPRTALYTTVWNAVAGVAFREEL